MKLAICRCPVHGFYSVTVEDEESGTRVTPSKCCGRWDTVEAWRLSAADWRALSELAAKAADTLVEFSKR